MGTNNADTQGGQDRNQQPDRNQQADRQQNQQGSQQGRNPADPNNTHQTDTGAAGNRRDDQQR
jgi:hypothetical protein